MNKSLLALILLTVGVSVAGIYFPWLQQELALSWPGIKALHLWQLFTYPLVEPSGETSPLHFGYLVQLAFNMYILWTFGSNLIERAHPALFFALYFGATLAAGLTAPLFPHVILAGSTPPVYATLLAWMLLNPGAQLLLFFALPLRATWIILGIIALTLFFAITYDQWLAASTLLASLLYAYLFTLIAWRQESPFAILWPFERRLLRALEKKGESYHHSKIYDIKSGSPLLDDEQFMDAMLDRISRHGEESLTAEEKKRMREISTRKR